MQLASPEKRLFIYRMSTTVRKNLEEVFLIMIPKGK